MDSKKLVRLSFDEIQGAIDQPVVIENFIMFDTEKVQTLSSEFPFILDGIIFGICLRGSGKFRMNFKEYEISENTLFVILPNQIFEPLERSDDIFIEILSFSVNFFMDLPFPKNFNTAERISKYPCLKISDKDMKDILSYHSFIVKSYNNRKHANSSISLKYLLYALLVEIHAIYVELKVGETNHKYSRSEEIVEQFLKLLRENHRNERGASFYADKLFITSKYLSGVLKKITGRSLNTWIDGAVVIAAKILLKSSEQTVLQISEELNFPNPSFFGRFFKQHVGMTPLEYRSL